MRPTVQFHLTPISGFYLMLLLGETVGGSVVIWGHGNLFLRCIMGSILGSIGLIAWMGLNQPKNAEPSGDQDLRGLAREFVLSVIAGLVGAPLLIKYVGWQPDGDAVVFCSAAVSFLFTSALRSAWPRLQQAGSAWMDRFRFFGAQK